MSQKIVSWLLVLAMVALAFTGALMIRSERTQNALMKQGVFPQFERETSWEGGFDYTLVNEDEMPWFFIDPGVVFIDIDGSREYFPPTYVVGSKVITWGEMFNGLIIATLMFIGFLSIATNKAEVAAMNRRIDELEAEVAGLESERDTLRAESSAQKALLRGLHLVQGSDRFQHNIHG